MHSFFFSIQTYSDRKKDQVFKWINEKKTKRSIIAIHSMDRDGNCGFRGVSFGLYRDQSKWPEVKQKMLEVYNQYQFSLHNAHHSTELLNQDTRNKIIEALQWTTSPCNNTDFWFSTFIYPQIVADTFKRPVILYTYTQNKNQEGKLVKTHEAVSYYPLIEMDTKNLYHPIPLLYKYSHIYYVEIAHTPTGRLPKSFEMPTLNPDHDVLRNKHPTECADFISHIGKHFYLHLFNQLLDFFFLHLNIK